MQIQINTSNGVENNEALQRWASEEISQSLGHFATHVTRIEAHLSNVRLSNSDQGDKTRCVLEARPTGLQPLAVTEHAANVEEALRGACAKLKNLLTSTLGRHDGRRDRETIRKDGDALRQS